MNKELEKRINETENGKEIRLTGRMEIRGVKSNCFLLGKMCLNSLINICRSDIVIDGSDAELDAEIEDSTGSDWSLFFIQPTARNVCMRNMTIRVHIQNPAAAKRQFFGIYNTAYGLKVENCRIEIYAEKQLGIAGIYNNGNLDTHMETRADNLVVNDCYIKAECGAEEYPKECAVYGLYNNLANSISLQNTFIYAINRGDGERQRAVGVYTNGRFGRFVGNNVKANGTHNVGKHTEEAHAFGFINEGLYSIISANNIVGEWAGMSVGLENRGEYARISSNKILATHTICGRSVRSYGDNSSIGGNIITSTSRNARLIEHGAKDCVIHGNIMEILMTPEECRSGCGIYAVGENVQGNVIAENILRNTPDCGIFADASAGIVCNNEVRAYRETVERAGRENVRLAEKLDEKNIRSIYE